MANDYDTDMSIWNRDWASVMLLWNKVGGPDYAELHKWPMVQGKPNSDPIVTAPGHEIHEDVSSFSKQMHCNYPDIESRDSKGEDAEGPFTKEEWHQNDPVQRDEYFDRIGGRNFTGVFSWEGKDHEVVRFRNKPHSDGWVCRTHIVFGGERVL